MAIYSFECKDCSTPFEVVCAISQYSPSQTCPSCSSQNVVRDYQEDCPTGAVVLSNDQIKLGHLAARNGEKLSKDEKEALKRKHNEYRETEPTADLPSGMSRVEKPKNPPKWH